MFEQVQAIREVTGAGENLLLCGDSTAPLPELKDGEYYARVTLGDASSSMNVRQSPTTQSPVVARLANGRRVVVSGEPDGEGWVQIATAEFGGYAKLEYLTREYILYR